MAILKSKQIEKMSKNEKMEKLKELRFSLVKGNVTANRASSKTKEIKRAISRILTSMNKKTDSNSSKEVKEALKK